MGLLHSKHQKLILQCYPPGKSADKKPNPLELSYLLYYASTRRVKLEKVINYLARKTKADAGRGRSGNLQVTLTIVAALIDKCYNNLNVFALQVCSILLLVLGTRELPLVKLTVASYGVLCHRLDGNLFSGDRDFVNLFCHVTKELVALGVDPLHHASPDTLEWRRVALAAVRHAFACVGYNRHVSTTVLAVGVPLLADQVYALLSHDQLLSRLHSNLNVDKDERRLLRVATARSAARSHRHRDPDSVCDDDLTDEALEGLKTLFNTTLSSQIADATKCVVEHSLRVDADDDARATTFLGMCASWIPVQLRFVTLLTLLRSISRASELVMGGADSAASFHRMVHFAKSILGLVSSDFSMIGLSVTDVIQRLLSLQLFLHFSIADHLAPEKVATLSRIYSACICSLASHVYYFDQALDSIETILVHIDTLLISATATNCHTLASLVLLLLDDVSNIVDSLALNSSAIIRNRASLEVWSVTLQLLSFPIFYKEFHEFGSRAQISQIQSKYLLVFASFLTKELVHNSSGDACDNDVGDFNNLSKPNYNDYLENRQNVLSQLIAHSDDFLSDPELDLGTAAKLVSTLRLVLLATGVNFVHNFLPFFQHWQLINVSTLISACAKDTAAYLLLQDLISVLVAQYEKFFTGDAARLELETSLKEDIASRCETGLWVSQLDEKSDSEALEFAVKSSDTPSGDLCSKVNRHMLQEFCSSLSLHGWTAQHKTAQLGGSDDLLQKVSERTTIPSSTLHLLHPKPTSGGLGLGTISDISSIHSGFLNHSLRNLRSADITEATNETLVTHSILQDYNDYRLSLVPRVPELRSLFGGTASPRSGGVLAHENGTPRSVLEKQLLTTDMSSILDGLTSDDDNEIVV